jgi:hypothetical protein
VNVILTLLQSGVATEKRQHYRHLLLFGFVTAKKATTMNRHLLLGFRCSKEKEEDNFRQLL